MQMKPTKLRALAFEGFQVVYFSESGPLPYGEIVAELSEAESLAGQLERERPEVNAGIVRISQLVNLKAIGAACMARVKGTKVKP